MFSMAVLKRWSNFSRVEESGRPHDWLSFNTGLQESVEDGEGTQTTQFSLGDCPVGDGELWVSSLRADIPGSKIGLEGFHRVVVSVYNFDFDEIMGKRAVGGAEFSFQRPGGGPSELSWLYEGDGYREFLVAKGTSMLSGVPRDANERGFVVSGDRDGNIEFRPDLYKACPMRKGSDEENTFDTVMRCLQSVYSRTMGQVDGGRTDLTVEDLTGRVKDVILYAAAELPKFSFPERSDDESQ